MSKMAVFDHKTTVAAIAMELNCKGQKVRFAENLRRAGISWKPFDMIRYERRKAV